MRSSTEEQVAVALREINNCVAKGDWYGAANMSAVLHNTIVDEKIEDRNEMHLATLQVAWNRLNAMTKVKELQRLIGTMNAPADH